MHADILIVTLATTDGDETRTFTDVRYLHTWNRLFINESDGNEHEIDKIAVGGTEVHNLAAAAA